MNGVRIRIALTCVALTLLGSCPVLPPEDLVCAVDGNGCGPFFLGPVVPLFINCFEVSCRNTTVRVCLTCACNVHDNCYTICGEDKLGCDLRFLDNLLAVCQDALDGGCGSKECEERAHLFAALVVLGGAPSFANGQAACEQTSAVEQALKDILDPGATELPFDLPYQDDDGDLLPDDWEIYWGLDPADPRDAYEDFDGDGLPNIAEFFGGTDPWRQDTDGDGTDDRTYLEKLSAAQ